MTLLHLFLAFLRVGLFSVGGGYAAMPLIQNQTVNVYGWISESAFTDLVAIAEMTPGPIALNAATFVGMRASGFPGALVATFGCVLPSLVIVTVLAKLYLRFKSGKTIDRVLSCLRPTVVALIATAFLTVLNTAVFGGLSASLTNINWLSVLLFGCAFTSIVKFKVNPVLAMLSCGAIDLLTGVISGL